MTFESTGGWTIWVRTRTERKADPEIDPASLDRMQLYLPRSVERTLAINRLPSSRIWIRPEKLISPSEIKSKQLFLATTKTIISNLNLNYFTEQMLTLHYYY
jgi:hypothetical protein